MSDFSRYDINIQDYYNKLPNYLQTPGGNALGKIRLLYDIINDYKNNMVDLWSKFNTNELLAEYLVWKSNNPSLDDSEWKYTDLVEKICKTYDIIREHPVELDPIGSPGVGTTLRNSHMLRLLKIKTMGVGFDGSKEKLEEILATLFTGDIKYIVQTVNQSHAEANIYLIKSASGDSFDQTDEALFAQGYYFLELLGITLNFSVVNTDTLVYDYTDYDINQTGILATQIVEGSYYVIETIGTTDFTLIGASSNTVGLQFLATGTGTGTGTVAFGNKYDEGESS